MSERNGNQGAISIVKHQTYIPVRISALIITIIAVSTLVAYQSGDWQLVSFGPDYIPMAPLTAFLFMIYSGLLILQTIKEISPAWNGIFRTGIVIISIISAYTLLNGILSVFPDVENLIINIPAQVSDIQVGKISLVSASFLIISCLSLFCGTSREREYRNLSAVLAIVIFALGLMVIEGYWYNTPFLYGGSIVPVAFSTGCCFLLAGYALLELRKDDTKIGEALYGESIKAKLLRTFLPVMILFVLIEGYVFSVLVRPTSFLNPVLWSGIIAVISILVIVLITTILSGKIGAVIENAETERDTSLRELSRIHADLADAYKILEIQEEKLLQNLEEITSHEEELRTQNDELLNKQIALECSETRYFELFDHISSGVVVYEAVHDGEDFIIRDCNRAAERIEQIKRSSVIGKSLLEAFPAVRELGIFNIFQQVMKTGNPQSLPILYYHDDRVTGWRENYIYKLPSGEIVSVSDDVTERKKSEDALKESEQKFRIVADYTYDWETWENPDGEYVYISPSCEQITGYSPEEFKNQPDLQFRILHPLDKELWKNHLNESKTTDKIYSLHFRIIHRDGGVRWIHHVCQPIIISSGQNLGRRGSNRDVTHEKEADEALRERDAQYRMISENSADVIWVLNLESGKITYVSPSVYKLRGYTQDEVLSQSIQEVLTLESFQYVSEQLPGRISRFQTGDESERVQITEVSQPRKDGTIVPTEVVTTLIPDEKGNVIEILGVSRDITERKNAESRIKKAIDQINQNLETLAILNDQIRNPLAVMEIVAEDIGGESGEIIHEQITHIDEIIDKLDRGYLYSEKVRAFLTKHYYFPYRITETEETDS